jgi:hypothetical protein
MNTKDFPPSFESVRDDLSDFIKACQDALDAGCDDALKSFEAKMWPIEPGLHAYHARYYAGLRLQSQLPDLQPPLVWLRENNASLYFVGTSYEVRILKSGHDFDDEGNLIRRLPTPGHSTRRSDYYTQEPLLKDQYAVQLQLPGLEASPIRLILLWDAGPSFQLNALDLVLPRSGGRTKATVDYWWYESVLLPTGLGGYQDEDLASPEQLDEPEVRRRGDRRHIAESS